MNRAWGSNQEPAANLGVELVSTATHLNVRQMLVPSTPLPTTSKMLMPRRQTAASADTPAGGRNWNHSGSRNSSGPTGRRCSPCGLTLHTPSPGGAVGSMDNSPGHLQIHGAPPNSSGFLRPVFSLDKLREQVSCSFSRNEMPAQIVSGDASREWCASRTSSLDSPDRALDAIRNAAGRRSEIKMNRR